MSLYNDTLSLFQKCKEAIPTSKYICANPKTNQPYCCIFHVWDIARKHTGYPRLPIHDLRHSFTRTLVNNGASLYVVQKLLGHSKSQTTERYAHLASHTLIQAASLIDKAFSK